MSVNCRDSEKRVTLGTCLLFLVYVRAFGTSGIGSSPLLGLGSCTHGTATRRDATRHNTIRHAIPGDWDGKRWLRIGVWAAMCILNPDPDARTQGEYIFPPYIVPPAPYVPPGMFSGDPLPSQPSGTVNDTPDIAVIASRKRAASVSASPPPRKRGRGRPRGSTKKAPKPANGPPPATDTNPTRAKRKSQARSSRPEDTCRDCIGAQVHAIVDVPQAKEKKASAYDAKLTLEREKFEMDKTKGKVDMAHKILSTPGASDQVKDAANAFLLTLFAS
ncbi:hypothetical protein DFH08DRAFT_822331 [Mycena albidolilacea]|uniref:Uncharacterized protein n=1 Tax=Mycena albidolilacea TaxID=1033008 RepID=A0AAD6Z983_9AGAR|nr:hypothetical protein DFH08DRAFT_822331 [Mycena albidolilacea]